MKPRISLRQSLQDPNLLGGALTGESWAAWRTLLVASMGESLTEDERATFRALTGRDREPLQRVDQFAAVIGRRGGKSRAMATLACYLAGLCEHTDALVPGELLIVEGGVSGTGRRMTRGFRASCSGMRRTHRWSLRRAPTPFLPHAAACSTFISRGTSIAQTF